ncbi:transposase [Thauera propionica]|uniref:transposase n=1 Tax=Thauera propionica TaxID=2019431 RepID=UPI0010565416|nr:transposase [Thauera propionica]
MDVVISRRTRRTHSEASKQSVISACREPGVSVGGVALASGLNANQVHRWMRERGIEPPSRRKPVGVGLTALAEPGFMPVQVAPAVETPVIRLEAQRGNARVKLEWPLQAADACGASLREWLA